VTIDVEDTGHAATESLGGEWVIADEIYQFRDGSFSKDSAHMLLSIDTDKTKLEPQKMKKGEYYPVSWTRKEGEGRVFYTSLGHREDVWTNPKFQQHLTGGLKWATGLTK
jgi:type 1 glutamine amidotransferase